MLELVNIQLKIKIKYLASYVSEGSEIQKFSERFQDFKKANFMEI